MLNERSEHEVDLFEADDRPGGHANTVTFERPGKPGKVDVDTFVFQVLYYINSDLLTLNTISGFVFPQFPSYVI